MYRAAHSGITLFEGSHSSSTSSGEQEGQNAQANFIEEAACRDAVHWRQYV